MEPLISLCIITYNSSITIVDTLDSLKNQIYQNIELIVSDDGSKDDTVNIVKDWIEINGNRFVNTQIVTVEKNTGVALNLDRAIKASSGEWIKILAGDDKLKPECISTFYEYTKKSNNQFFLCDVDIFCDDGIVSEKTKSFYRFFFGQVSKTLKQKKRNVLTYFDYPGPAWFFSRNLFNAVGGIDQKYTMMDEWPFIYKVLQNNYDVVPVKEKLVLYRVSNTSLSHGKNPLGNEFIVNQNRDFFYDVRIHDLRKRFMFLHILDQKLYYYTMKKQFAYYAKNNKKSKILSIPYYFSIVYIKRKLTLLKYIKLGKKD